MPSYSQGTLRARTVRTNHIKLFVFKPPNEKKKKRWLQVRCVFGWFLSFI